MKALLRSRAFQRAALWSAVAVAAISAYLYSQGRTITGKPREAIAKQAIEESLKRQVPTAVARSLLPCRATHVNRVTVLEVGSAGERGGAKAWLVSARVWGEMESVEPFGRRAVKDFSGEGRWLVSRDPLGSWSAVVSEY